MPFGTPITIKEAVENIHKKRYLLPAIQREFVWKSDQIERLFDSLMRGYPINSFLFWKVDRKEQKNYQFYEFIRDYHELDNKNNIKANVSGDEELTAILDGQQRLTSIYIGLKGSYAYKMAKKRKDNPNSYPIRRLYLNLLANSGEVDLDYDFKFLSNDEAEADSGKVLWFLVGDILDFKSLADVMGYIMNNIIGKYPEDQINFANNSLSLLYQIAHQNQSINFFLEEGESLDKVLDIFVRINSGGTQLSYSDLLLSIASAEWKDLDAREEINSFVKDINRIGSGFNFNKDFVLKSCLALINKEISFKVENFNENTLRDIENSWSKIKKSIFNAIELVASFGYQQDTLTSNNAIIPIAYYLICKNNPKNFHLSKSHEEDREKISKWLKMALLKKLFSGQPDGVLKQIREVIKNSNQEFPLDKIFDKLKGTNKSLSFDNDDFHNLMGYEYGEPYTYSVLSFLYKNFDYKNRFHIDHIYPKWIFTKKELLSRGIGKEDVDVYLKKYNSLANLQLMEGIPNQEKSGKEVSVWMGEVFSRKSDAAAYRKKNYIPNIDLNMDNFLEFIRLRELFLIEEFKKIIK